MKVKKLGIAWGAAYEEAEPIEIQHGFARVEAYSDEGGDLVLLLPKDATLEWIKEGIYVKIPAN